MKKKTKIKKYIFEKNCCRHEKKGNRQTFFQKKEKEKILTLKVHRNFLRLQMVLKLCQ